MTEPHNTKWLSYQQASQWAQSQNIMTCDQWRERRATGLPEGVPADPETVYGDEFIGWHEFLGVQPARNGSKMFWSCARVQEWARQHGIKSGVQWKEIVKEGGLPTGVPAQPYKVYKDQFKGWAEFLGVVPLIFSYEEAVSWGKNNGITSQLKWKAAHKKLNPEGIPLNPNRVYKNDFKSWGDFLGTGRIANKDREFLSYEDASVWAQEQGIFSSEEWFYRARLGFPPNIPVCPSGIYGKDFRWGHFLNRVGTHRKNHIPKKRSKYFVSYEEALLWARSKGICSSAEWVNVCKQENPPGIPSCPYQVYTEFTNWGEFLGLKKIHGMSKIERMLRHVLETLFNDKFSDFAQPIITDNEGKRHRVDICLPKSKIIVEYDGAYWHEHREEKDVEKTKSLLNSDEKWSVIRVRGKPLNLLREDWDLSIEETLPSAQQIFLVLQHFITLHENLKLKLCPQVYKKISSMKLDDLKNINFRDILEKYDGYKSYEEAAKWGKQNNIQNRDQWKTLHKESNPPGIPLCPDSLYHEFTTWGSFLGTGKLGYKNRTFLSYNEVSNWAINEGIQSVSQWKLRCKKGIPNNIPTNPDISYPQEFKDNNGWWGFFGKPKPLRKYMK